MVNTQHAVSQSKGSNPGLDRLRIFTVAAVTSRTRLWSMLSSLDVTLMTGTGCDRLPSPRLSSFDTTVACRLSATTDAATLTTVPPPAARWRHHAGHILSASDRWLYRSESIFAVLAAYEYTAIPLLVFL